MEYGITERRNNGISEFQFKSYFSTENHTSLNFIALLFANVISMH